MAGRRQRHIIIFINSHFSTWQYEKAKCYRVNIKQLKNLDSSDYIAILVLTASLLATVLTLGRHADDTNYTVTNLH